MGVCLLSCDVCFSGGIKKTGLSHNKNIKDFDQFDFITVLAGNSKKYLQYNIVLIASYFLKRQKNKKMGNSNSV